MDSHHHILRTALLFLMLPRVRKKITKKMQGNCNSSRQKLNEKMDKYKDFFEMGQEFENSKNSYILLT